MSESEPHSEPFKNVLDSLCKAKGLPEDTTLRGEAFQTARCSRLAPRLEIVWSQEAFSEEQLALQSLMVEAASESGLSVSRAKDAFIGHIALHLLDGASGKIVVATFNSSNRLFIPFYTTGLHTPIQQ